MKKLIMIIVMLSNMSAYTQTNCNYEYWFAAPAPSVSHGNQPIKLLISNQENIAGTVEIYLHSLNQSANNTHTISQNGSLEIDLTSNLTHVINQVNNNSVDNKSILIKSTTELSVVYDCFGGKSNDPRPLNTEMFVLKGNAALDKKFIIPSQNNFRNKTSYSLAQEQVIIVATENNTVVNFNHNQSTTNNSNFPTAGQINNGSLPNSLTLQRGETFQLSNNNRNANSSFYGLKITSNKNIAVTISDCSIQNLGKHDPHDLIGDQLIGTNSLGKKYLVLNTNNLSASNPLDKVYILSTVNGTTISCLGDISGSITTPTVLNEGQQFTIDMNTNSHFLITSNNPIYVYHLSARNTTLAANATGDIRDYGSAIVPPIDKCTGISKVNFRRTGNETTDSYKISIVKPTGTTIISNPTSLLPSSTSWTTISGFDYTIIEANSIVALNSMFELSSTNSKFHVGIHNNVGASFSYGFISNFSELNICSEFTICSQNGETAILEAPNLYSNYQWFLNGNAISGATNAQYTANQIGSYYVTANCNGETIQSNDINVNQESDCESQNDDTNEDTAVTSYGPINFKCCKTDLEIFNASGTPNPLPVVSSVHNGTPISAAKETFVIHRNATIPITELRVVVTDIQFKYNYDDCGKCINNPALWGTLNTPIRTPIGNNGLVFQAQQPYRTMTGSTVTNHENIRELIWSNPNGVMLVDGDQFEVHYLLPPASEIPCCVIEVKICTKISWKDANCCENHKTTCSIIKIE